MEKYIRFALALFYARLFRKRVPLLVTLCLTNRCNLRCVYCYADYYPRNHQEPSTKQLLDLIDTLWRMGTRYISLNGGEALLREDIEEIVDRVTSKGMLCHLSTNGLLVGQKINVLRKVDSVTVSLDGAQRSNDKNRGTGVYGKVMQAIEVLSKEGIDFHTHTVLTKTNPDAIEEVLSLAKKFGFKAQFSPLRREDSPDKEIALEDHDLRSVVGRILDAQKEGYPVFFPEEAYRRVLNWPFPYSTYSVSQRSKVLKAYGQCYIKDFSCHIEANGFVYPCIVLVNKSKLLNVWEEGFEAVWNSLAETPCEACWNVCCNQINLMFSLRPFAFFNVVSIISHRLFRKKGLSDASKL